MANVTWVGKQIARPKVMEITIASSTAAQTFIVTAGLVKQVQYIAGATETTATIAAALLALLQTEPSGEFRELTFAQGSTTSKMKATGPSDGAIFTLSVSGTGTISIATLTAPLSPHDIGDGANYSTGALPNAADTLIYENNAIDALYNAAALTAIALAAVIRRSTYTGQRGLPDQNTLGYPEYRNTYLELDTVSILEVQPQTDRVGQTRIKVTTASPCTFTVRCASQGQLDSEALDVIGLVSTSTVMLTGGSIVLASLAGQTNVISSLIAEDAAVRMGSGNTLTTATFKNCQDRLDCSWTTLTMLVGGNTEVTGTAAGGAAGTIVQKGTLLWRSSGATGTSPVVGSGGTIDFSQAPASVTVGGTVELNAGATWLDPASRIATSYNIKLNRCTIADVTIDVGTNHTLAVS